MIGMLGSAYFAGWMLGSIIMSRIGDLYGRKLPFYTSVLASALAYLWSLVTQSLQIQIFLLFIIGLT
jgi:MFS family permease